MLLFRSISIEHGKYFRIALFFFTILLCDWSRKLASLSQPISGDLVTHFSLPFRQFSWFYFEFSLATCDIFLPMIGCFMYFEFAFTSPNWKASYLLVSLPCFTLLCFTLPSFCYSFFTLHTLSFASLYALWRNVCLSLSLNQLDAKPLLHQIMLSLFLGCLCVSTCLLEIVTFLLIGYCSYPFFLLQQSIWKHSFCYNILLV